MNIHSSLEELVETVDTLHQLERYARDEELLQLLHHEATRVEAHDQGREETTTGDYDVEYVPAVCAVTGPSESEKSHDDIQHVDGGHEDEEVVYENRQLKM